MMPHLSKGFWRYKSNRIEIFEEKEFLKMDAEFIQMIDSYIPNIYERYLDIKFRKEIELFVQFPERKIWKCIVMV